MALKDWKKVSKNQYRKGTEKIFIFENKTKIHLPQKKWEYSYTVYIDTKISDKQETFLTKAQATTYAKNYMRTH